MVGTGVWSRLDTGSGMRARLTAMLESGRIGRRVTVPRSGRVARAAWLLLLGLCLVATAACDRPETRNVVLLVVDTLRADHLGLYGYTRPTSPRLDAWAERGAVFENAFATSPWTLPSFASILTGRLPSEHGAGWPVDLESSHYLRTGLADEITPLPELLSRAGWRTAAFAGNPFVSREVGLGRGFEHFVYEADAKADRVVDEVVDWLAGVREERFFLMAHFMDPHLPYSAPPPFLGRFSEGEPRGLRLTQKSRWDSSLIPQPDREYLIDRYDEEIAFLDHQLGRLLAVLDETEDTLVLFTADHGEELFDHGGFEHGHTMMQELLWVPLIVVGPGVLPQRLVEPVSIADVAPTVLAATGLEGGASPPVRSPPVRSPAGRSPAGRSLWPLLERSGGRGEVREPLGRRMLWAESILYGTEQKVLLRWPYKLVLDVVTGERRLFDLAHDPGEREDLAAVHEEIADRMEATLRRRLLAETDVRGEAPTPDPATLRELEALGYVD